MTNILSDPTSFLYFVIALLSGITIHEFAHAYVADRFGDPTPRLHGRVTLNPLAHLDPIGTFALLFFNFGWGKPVPVDHRHFKNPIWDEIQVSLAGPFSNLALATLLSLILRSGVPNGLSLLLITMIQINLVLMVFNLIPIPPLDGSRILRLFIPETSYAYLEQYGLFILLAIFLVGGNLIGQLFDVTVVPLSHLLIGPGLF